MPLLLDIAEALNELVQLVKLLDTA